LVIADVSMEQHLPALVREMDIQSVLFVPLVARGEKIGILAFHYHSHLQKFTDVQADYARKLGTSVSLALGNAMLFDAERASVAREAQAREIAEKRAEEAEERRSILQALMDYVPEAIAVVDAPSFTIRMSSRLTGSLMGVSWEFLRDYLATEKGPGWHLRHADGITPASMDELPLTRAIKHGEVVTNKELVVVRDDGVSFPILASAGPIRDHLGAITGGVITFRDITPLKEARESLERAYEYERRIAQMLQRALLPEKPFIGRGYEVAAEYIPAFVGQEVGGDFYDIFITEDEQIGILIGDVSGKGIDAASLAASTRSTVRAFAYDMSDAGAALTHTNAVLCAQQTTRDVSQPFVTIFLAILNPETGHIHYASAGHPPPALHRATRDVKFLKFGRPPLGIKDGQKYEEEPAQLNEGDKIVLYTDGVSEANSGAVMFGMEGVEEILRLHGHRSPDEILRELTAAVNEIVQGKLADDVAVLVISRECAKDDR
jgi:serine phosphatase RsbU (regulator of sigma subunit)/PAS domain-containing protein